MITVEKIKERLKSLMDNERESAFVYAFRFYAQRCVSCAAKKNCLAKKWPQYTDCENIALAYMAGLETALFEIELQEQYSENPKR